MKSFLFCSAFIFSMGAGLTWGYVGGRDIGSKRLYELEASAHASEISAATCRMRLEEFAQQWMIPLDLIQQEERIQEEKVEQVML